MKRIYQTRFGADGNCLAACIASLLECPLAAVDFSCSEDPDGWDELVRAKVARFGMDFLHIGGRAFKLYGAARVLYIAHGPSPRGRRHAVLHRAGRLVHDPHPQGGGILQLEQVSFLVPLRFA